jgi:hypothetical protein
VKSGCIRALSFEWFSPYFFVLHLLIVNILQVVSASRCRLNSSLKWDPTILKEKFLAHVVLCLPIAFGFGLPYRVVLGLITFPTWTLCLCNKLTL